MDCDSNPNLATSLGLEDGMAATLRTLPKRAFDESKTVAELLEEFAVPAPDGVQIVLAARIEQAGGG